MHKPALTEEGRTVENGHGFWEDTHTHEVLLVVVQNGGKEAQKEPADAGVEWRHVFVLLVVGALRLSVSGTILVLILLRKRGRCG